MVFINLAEAVIRLCLLQELINKLKFYSESCHESAMLNHTVICPGRLTKTVAKKTQPTSLGWIGNICILSILWGAYRVMGLLLQDRGPTETGLEFWLFQVPSLLKSKFNSSYDYFESDAKSYITWPTSKLYGEMYPPNWPSFCHFTSQMRL